MLTFGKKGTEDGVTFFEVNRFLDRYKNKADIEFDVFISNVYKRHEKRVASWIETINNVATYEFKYEGIHYQFGMHVNNLD